MKKAKKLLIYSLVFLSCLYFFSYQVNATFNPETTFGLKYARDVGLPEATGNDPVQGVINIIKFLLTLLGLIALIMILYGGFMWMTSAGNEDRVGKAKRIIGAAVVGMVIILAAWIIVSFVVTKVAEQIAR